MSTKFRLLTIEEEFAAIGLIHESKTAPVEEPPVVSEDDDEDEDDEDDGEPVEEALKLKRRVKKSAALRMALKRARRKYYKQHKGQEIVRARKYAKSSRGKKRTKLRLSFWKKHAGMAGKPNMRLAGLDRVANMVEEVGGILDTIGERKNREFVRGYANIALISDTMARGFEALGADIQEEELTDLGKQFAEMAEQSAKIAEALEAEEIELDEELEAAFKSDMDDLLSGLEIYADMTEDEDESDDESDDEDEDDSGN
jgi:hypothetical protein